MGQNESTIAHERARRGKKGDEDSTKGLEGTEEDARRSSSLGGRQGYFLHPQQGERFAGGSRGGSTRVESAPRIAGNPTSSTPNPFMIPGSTRSARRHGSIDQPGLDHTGDNRPHSAGDLAHERLETPHANRGGRHTPQRASYTVDLKALLDGGLQGLAAKEEDDRLRMGFPKFNTHAVEEKHPAKGTTTFASPKRHFTTDRMGRPERDHTPGDDRAASRFSAHASNRPSHRTGAADRTAKEQPVRKLRVCTKLARDEDRAGAELQMERVADIDRQFRTLQQEEAYLRAELAARGLEDSCSSETSYDDVRLPPWQTRKRDSDGTSTEEDEDIKVAKRRSILCGQLERAVGDISFQEDRARRRRQKPVGNNSGGEGNLTATRPKTPRQTSMAKAISGDYGGMEGDEYYFGDGHDGGLASPRRPRLRFASDDALSDVDSSDGDERPDEPAGTRLRRGLPGINEVSERAKPRPLVRGSHPQYSKWDDLIKARGASVPVKEKFVIPLDKCERCKTKGIACDPKRKSREGCHNCRWGGHLCSQAAPGTSAQAAFKTEPLVGGFKEKCVRCIASKKSECKHWKIDGCANCRKAGLSCTPTDQGWVVDREGVCDRCRQGRFKCQRHSEQGCSNCKKEKLPCSNKTIIDPGASSDDDPDESSPEDWSATIYRRRRKTKKQKPPPRPRRERFKGPEEKCTRCTEQNLKCIRKGPSGCNNCRTNDVVCSQADPNAPNRRRNKKTLVGGFKQRCERCMARSIKCINWTEDGCIYCRRIGVECVPRDDGWKVVRDEKCDRCKERNRKCGHFGAHGCNNCRLAGEECSNFSDLLAGVPLGPAEVFRSDDETNSGESSNGSPERLAAPSPPQRKRKNPNTRSLPSQNGARIEKEAHQQEEGVQGSSAVSTTDSPAPQRRSTRSTKPIATYAYPPEQDLEDEEQEKGESGEQQQSVLDSGSESELVLDDEYSDDNAIVE